MRRLTTPAVLLAVLFCGPVSVVRAELSAEQVRGAIDKAVTFLKQRQRNDGSWAGLPSFPGGVTGLCTLALLHAGVDPDDPSVAKAVDLLRRTKFDKTYTVALQTMVFAKVGRDADLGLIERNVRWLEATQMTDGDRVGSWDYPQLSRGDNSNAQFALLALHEAERAGVKVNDRTWRLAKAYWEDCQNVDGSWGYYKGQPGTGSMTCAGVASLIITSDKVQQADAKATGDRIQCCGQGDGQNDNIERAVDWLGRNFSVTGNPGTRQNTWLLYYLYGVERVGRLTGHRFIGGHDWYREGSDYLVRTQDGLSGYIKGVGQAEGIPEIGTGLALLFLSKGRRPVLMAKLQHASATDLHSTDWNQHRSDVGNLTKYVESKWGFDVTSQTVNLRKASVEDLLQTPVLYYCGSTNPLPPEPAMRQQLAQKLRDYLDRGGFLFAEGYCGGVGFDVGFRELMTLVFPEPEYRLRLLDPEHPVWHAEQWVNPRYVRPLWGIEFGCRTSVVYAPIDPPARPRPSLSCLWELSRSGRNQQFDPTVQAQIDAAMAVGINILAYATNREIGDKMANWRSKVDERPEDNVDRGKLFVAKLRHPGGCNAAPRALINLMEEAGDQLELRTAVREQLLQMTNPEMFDYHLLFMHGRNRFQLLDTERTQLKTYLERGGMLLADSICASSAFTESFRHEIAATFPEAKLEPIPADDPI
ncbi:MAG TPA: DUF4159 domain-containing protein, partial [Thermoguttaceae bacterium]|nr:DUF4159 domain-containing protein [Thermoguttaceae bacterium]